MVAIIGVLAAVAIPAYQRYQVKAKEGVVNGSLNNIKKAFAACVSVETYATCTTSNTINMTLAPQAGSTISIQGGGAANICYKVVVDTREGCVTFDSADPHDINSEKAASATATCASSAPHACT